jgi:hypothetical protein
VAVALGLVITWSYEAGGDAGSAWSRVALLGALAGLPVVAGGLVVHRGLAADAGAAALRTAGTATALLGVLIMLAAVVPAWPRPLPVVLVCGLDFLALTVVAIRYDLPVAHAAALPCLALGYLTGFQLVQGSITMDGAEADLTAALGSADSGLALAGLFVLLAAAAEGLARAHRRADAGAYALGGGIVALASLLLVTLPDRAVLRPSLAAAVYAGYGLALPALNARWRRPLVASAGLALLVAATLWALWWGFPDRLPPWGAILAAEALALGVVGVLCVGRGGEVTAGDLAPFGRSPLPFACLLGEALVRSAEGTALVALAAAVWAAVFEMAWALAYVVAGLCLFALFLLLAVVERRALLARVAGGLLIATGAAGAGWLAPQAGADPIALGIAATGLVMAAVAVAAPRLVPGSAPRVAVLGAWRETALGAGLLALLLALATVPAHGPAPLHPWTGGLLAATALTLAWSYQAVWLTWAGSTLALGSIVAALMQAEPRLDFPAPLLGVALLIHSTAVLAAGLRLRRGSTHLRVLFAEPFLQAALLSSCLALPLLVPVRLSALPVASAGLFWLAVLWLALATLNGWPGLVSAAQAVLCLAVLFGTTAWLQAQDWFLDHPRGYPGSLLDPRSLQAYGFGLAGLSMAWLTVRIALRSNTRVRPLLEPDWPAVDRVVLDLLVVAQLGLAVAGLLPGLINEVAPPTPTPFALWPRPDLAALHGPAALGLAGASAVVLAVGLWGPWRADAVLGLMALGLTATLLVTGGFEASPANALLLRSGLAAWFLALSVPLWGRAPLGRVAGHVGAKVPGSVSLYASVRGFLLVGGVLPVLLLAILDGLLRVTGRHPDGAAGDGPAWLVVNALPLALVSLGLVGHALRERSPGDAFAAGLVANLAVTGSYALAFVGANAPLDGNLEQQLGVRLLQLGTTTGAVWFLFWYGSRTWLRPRPAPRMGGAPALLQVQLWLAAAGIGWLLAWAVTLLVALYPLTPEWSHEAGSTWSWLALGATAVATYLLARSGGFVPAAAGFVGFAALCLAACSIERAGPGAGWGHRSLLLGWGAYPLAWVLGAGLAGVVGGGAHSWRKTAEFWVVVAGVLVVPFGLSAAAGHVKQLLAAAFWAGVAGVRAFPLSPEAAGYTGDLLVAAIAVALVGLAVAGVAVWRRSDAWAFTAGLGVNLAASLAVCYAYPASEFNLPSWWVPLLQANVIAGAAVALVWLALRGRLPSGPAVPGSGLRSLQTNLALFGNYVLLAAPVVMLWMAPGEPVPQSLAAAGNVWGWVALALALGAAAWHLSRTHPRRLVHLLGGMGLGVGALAACAVARDTADTWPAYHLLTASWAAAGLIVLTVGTAGDRVRSRLALAGESAPLGLARPWVLAIGAAVLALALRGTLADDPEKPYWSAGATLAVAGLTGALALWSVEPLDVYVSGLLVNVAGMILWRTWGPATAHGLVLTNVLCFAVASACWSAIELLGRRRFPPEGERSAWLPFPHTAATLGWCLLGALTAWAVLLSVRGAAPLLGGRLAWTAFTALACALALSLWDRRAGFALPFLYVLGVMGIGLALHQAALPSPEFGRFGCLALAGYAFLTAAAAWVAPRAEALRQTVSLPERPAGWARRWFVPLQVLTASAAVALSVWVCLAFPGQPQRLGGPLAVTLLLPAGVLTSAVAGRGRAEPPRGLHYATLALGPLALCELGWALTEAAGHSAAWLWLHRDVLLMVALAVTTAVYGVGMARQRRLGDWADSGRRLGPVLGLLALALVPVILVQEAFLYEGPKTLGTLLVRLRLLSPDAVPGGDAVAAGEPMAPLAVGIVAGALGLLIVAGLCFAVLPGRDPLGLSERGRTAYVYAAEVLLVLVLVHVRLALPGLFHRGLLAQYWPFAVMAIAFLGVGLSEFFGRRGLAVLAEPLERTGVFLPLLPVVAFWILSPGNYALLWFLAGLLYAFLSVARHSFRFALLAALAANTGLWVLLHHRGLFFWEHPQLWLIPIALVALVAEQLNRDRLQPAQSAAVRYLALIAIYVSSTADMFLAGLGTSVVLPLVLAVLSVLGVLAGMVLHVRAFLFLGTTFLLFVVLTVIWHAGVDEQRTWILWTSGICLGAAIVALFGLFEKRRNDVLQALERLRQWD